MTAALVLPSGKQYPIAPEGIENMLRHYRVSASRTNGSQTQFTLTGAEQPFAIVANAHSDAHDILEQAYERDRKAAKQGKE